MNYSTTEKLQIALAYASAKTEPSTSAADFLKLINEMNNTLSSIENQESAHIDTGISEFEYDLDSFPV